MRFQGQYYDQESGLHYNRHRYYNPNTGRYLTPDPIKLAGGLNSYQYVPSPTGWVDPLGLSCVPGDCPSAPAEINADTLDQSTIDAVLSFEKGNRPEPEIYLSKTYRDAHAALFRNGTARIQSTAPTGIIGRTETWVLPKSVAELAIDKADGNVSKLEFYLGLDKGYLGDKPVLVLIANPNNYRIPSGNEYGANYFLRPGGFTSLGGLPEAIIDPTKAN